MALYVPNPDRGSVEDLIEALSRELVDRYRAAEDELIREIVRRAIREQQLVSQLPETPAGRGLTVAQRRRQNRILAELAGHRAVALRELQAKAAALVAQLRAESMARRIIETAASEGEAAAAAQMGFAARPAAAVIPFPVVGGQAALSATTLTSTATQAVAALVLNLDSRLEILNQRITRYPQDAYQRIVSIYSPNTILGVTTSRVQQAQAVQRFLAEGIPSFEDRGGRRWTIGAYAEMAGRTSVNRAFNDAAVWRMQQSSIDLVTIVRGLDSCRKCAEWAGKILSTNGARGTVTVANPLGGTETVDVAGTLDDARNAGWNHPNCRCRVAPYLAGVTVISDDSTYDEQAEHERAEQRRLEREIRSAKRTEASAMTDVDRARAAAKVREAQTSMREFIRTTGRRRDSYREQLHFADGRGGPRTAPRRPTAPAPKPRTPALDIQVSASTRLGQDIRAARASIAKVHSIPNSLTQAAIVRLADTAHEMGSFGPIKSVIKIRGNGPTVQLTTAHEIGHYLDWNLLGSSTKSYETGHITNDLTREWLDKVRATDAVKKLGSYLGVDPRLDPHLKYLLSPEELWGRAYAQWIATRSGDAAMLAHVEHWLTSSNPLNAARQWAADDFEPVADAIDAIFRDKGLLK